MESTQWPPDVDEDRRTHLVSMIKDWSIINGLVIRPSQSIFSAYPGILATTAPVTFFPTPFLESCFKEAVAIQESYNELYASIAADESWLAPIFQEYDLSLGLFRSDYMVHHDSDERPSLRQVEFNTIASSFGSLSTKVTGLHKHLQQAYPYMVKKATQLTENKAEAQLALGLAEAHKAYGGLRYDKKYYPSSSGDTEARDLDRLEVHETCILFVVQEDERNVFDQTQLISQLTKTHKIPVLRRTFKEIKLHSHISAENPLRPLIYRDTTTGNTAYEASVIYFRAGYSPADYKSDLDWEVRERLESSSAIKCPSVIGQLAGCKKIQQILASGPGHFPPTMSEETRSKLRATFGTIYPLDTSAAGLRARAMALSPEIAKGFVLKPQREGGGNNIYGEDIPGFLRKTPTDEWAAYILMEMIKPFEHNNEILRDGKVERGLVVSELGVFGTVLYRERGEGKLIEYNREAGYLLRTKGSSSQEGGVASGFGALDSPLLVPEELWDDVTAGR
ncbi:MAG: hypothetical protein M1814_001529 [Vezdaea aestivalis]|nr:MAG: hypothetical protein M1814_001529 [Vezdaea aestivalis]